MPVSAGPLLTMRLPEAGTGVPWPRNAESEGEGKMIKCPGRGPRLRLPSSSVCCV